MNTEGSSIVLSKADRVLVKRAYAMLCKGVKKSLDHSLAGNLVVTLSAQDDQFVLDGVKTSDPDLLARNVLIYDGKRPVCDLSEGEEDKIAELLCSVLDGYGPEEGDENSGSYCATFDLLEDGRLTVAAEISAMVEKEGESVYDSSEVSAELMAGLVREGVKCVRADYSGGGDSGEMSGLEIETDSGEEVSSELRAQIECFCETLCGNVGVNWYDNEGGGGNITWVKGALDFESCFYQYEREEVSNSVSFSPISIGRGIRKAA